MALNQHGTHGQGESLVEVDHVTKLFGNEQGIIEKLLGREPKPVHAVEDVTLTINQGETLGIAGESGCGKTTLGKLLVKLYTPTSGEIRIDGRDITSLSGDDVSEFRKKVQMIFQDPFETLNPRRTIFQTVVEPLKINGIGDSYHDRRERAIQVLNDVGLEPAKAYLDQFPKELSGGERQRVAIARALVVDPEFIICDEPVSMLDVSIRASVLNLMQDLQEEYNLTYVFISHDLSLIKYMCDRTAIMYLGKVAEVGPTQQLIDNPKHPYTEALFDAVPEINLDDERTRANVTGEVPDPRNPPSGCRFHPRCAKIIPPADWEGTQQEFRRFVQFHRRLINDEFEREKFESVDELLERGLVLDLPEEFQAEGESTDSIDLNTLGLTDFVEETLRRAAATWLDESNEEALTLLQQHSQSVCTREAPEMRSVGTQQTACHLYATDANEDGAPD